MHVFLGITGASGAPYAARLLEALAAADCEIGVCASSAGVEVIATELYGNPRLSRDETLARLLERAPRRDPLRPQRLEGAVRLRLGEGRRLRRSARARWARSARSPPARCRTSSTAPHRSR